MPRPSYLSMRTVSDPPVAPRTSPRLRSREQLLHLLAEAAELEHNLLCCYLYAAFSLKRSSPDHSPAEIAAIDGWRKALMTIAFGEMTHLGIVANLTVAVGARPHFNRPNLPVDPGYHPASIVLKLAPFSIDTLDHFIFLERPSGAILEDGDGFKPTSTVERAPHCGNLMPAAPEYETLAEFYAEIRDCLRSLSTEFGEALFCGPPDSQLGEESLRMPGLSRIDSLDKALAAIDTIVEQGEGSAATGEESHFSRFRTMRREFEERTAARPQFAPTWPVATNPVMRKTHLAERVHVRSPGATEVLDLANAIYNVLLRVLSQTYGRSVYPAPCPPQTALKLMSAFSVIGEYLATLPAGEEHPGIHAGVSFTVLRATEPFVEGERECRLLQEGLDQLHHRAVDLSDRHRALNPVRDTLAELLKPKHVP